MAAAPKQRVRKPKAVHPTALKRAVVKIKPITVPGKGQLSFVLKFNDQVFQGKTDSLTQTLLDAKPDRLMTHVDFAVSFGDKTVNKLWMVHFARRIFVSKMAAAIQEKHIRLALGAPPA